MPVTRIRRDHAEYPRTLSTRLGDGAPEVLTLIGNPALLLAQPTAWFSSSRLPADLVIPALELARRWRDERVVVTSGFHSPLERECMALLLEGPQPLIVWSARGIGTMRLRREWRLAVEQGRLLVVSGYGEKVSRVTVRSAEGRNRMVAAMSDRVFVAAATPGGRLHTLAREVAARGQPLACFDHPSNHDLFLLGATAIPLG